jgi:hypothetical protein
VSLRVEVNHQRSFAFFGKGSSKVDRRGCFATTAFLICYGNYSHFYTKKMAREPTPAPVFRQEDAGVFIPVPAVF